MGSNPLTELIIFLLQIRCAELTTDGLVLFQFLLYRCKLCYQQLNFVFRSAMVFFASFRSFFGLLSCFSCTTYFCAAVTSV